MATPNPTVNLSGLARRLVMDGLLEEAVAAKAHEAALKKRTHFVSHLVDNKILSSEEIAWAGAQEFGVPLFDMNTMDKEMMPVKLVSEKLIKQHNALPMFKRANRLYIAVSDPTNLGAVDEFKFHTGVNTEAVLVDELQLRKSIENALEALDTTMTELMDSDLDNLDVSAADDEIKDGDDSEPDIDDTPVVRFVNKVLLDAINSGASDIHLEPYEKEFRVRFRNDGVLHEITSPPRSLAMRIIARLKVMSRMNIAERRVPQDGRIKMNLSRNRSIDFRVNTLPTLYGEKVVLRILDGGAAQIGVDALGFEPEQKELFVNAINKPYGMVLVTGPTGSGKTVSLYTGLNMLNTPDRNISTCEDPVEINLMGINQVNVNNKAGLDFSLALRAFLRQDPDIIMVGEIRDLETAEIAIKAAQTGHLVMSTLHTNDAPQTLTRLANMGVPAYNIAAAVHLILAQRLARRLCNNCKKERDIPQEALLKAGFREDQLDELTVYGPIGCDGCTGGYKGRVGIYQVMPVSEEMGRIIMEGGNSMELENQAQAEGVADLRESGLKKVAAGITSLEEIDRVTKE
ncbi:MAG: type IV-A pilus assembly ATPase PilB [Gammaproteobacteria bacterium]|nr:type IV-A pilus assembly ATPase PilB [Gammaproteobacteria bacterium]